MNILFYPNGIAGGQRTFHYIKKLGVKWTKDIAADGITHVHHYNYANRIDQTPQELTDAFPDKHIINRNLLNIKKDHLDDIHESVFGYRLRVDPTTHRGVCLKRSSQNAIHKATFVDCPIPPYEVSNVVRYSNKGEYHPRMYVRMIDTRINETTIRDWRLVVMGYKVVLTYEKHIASNCMFHVDKGSYFEVFPHYNISDIFSEEEVNSIHTFIERIGMDYGELDLLRDNSTGLPYIVDANPVPAAAIWKHTRQPDDTLDYLAETYKNVYLS